MSKDLCSSFFSSGFMSTLNRKISIRISAAINLSSWIILQCSECLSLSCHASTGLLPPRMCQTLCVWGKAQPHGTTWGPQHEEKMPGCWSAVRADNGIAFLPILGLHDFTLTWFSGSAVSCSKSLHAQKAPVLLTEGHLCKAAAAHI